MNPRPPHPAPRAEHGYTLVEVLVATVLGLIVSLAAFTMLEFTTRDVANTSARMHANQVGRLALEKIMLQLHSACVAKGANVIEPPSTPVALRFISETSPLRPATEEPTSELASVRLHEIIYKAASGSTEGTLVEKSWPSYGSPPSYSFNSEKEKPFERTLLKGVKQTGVVPVFQYYRYYNSTDTEPKLGQLYSKSVPPEKTAAEAEQIVKVTITFTLAPEGKQTSAFGADQPVALEDSATFRLAPASESSSANPNLSCSQ
jgi:prepilin-type N-terminal cleavage/methylation domain-containing protein